MLFGGRGEAAAAPASAQTTSSGGSCEFQSKGWCIMGMDRCTDRPAEFTKCLDAADVQTCSWFLEQLKAVSRIFLLLPLSDFPPVPGSSFTVLGFSLPLPKDIHGSVILIPFFFIRRSI